MGIMTSKIDYCTPKNGGIMMMDNENRQYWCKSSEEIRDLLQYVGYGNIMFSGEFDFANEHGFNSREEAIDMVMNAVK